MDTWRLERVPKERVRMDPDGHLVLPLVVVRDGERFADVPLKLLPQEAERLHAELCKVLDPDLTPAPCRDPRVSVSKD